MDEQYNAMEDQQNWEEENEEDKKQKRLKIISVILLILVALAIIYFGFLTVRRLFFPPTGKIPLLVSAGEDVQVWKKQSVQLKASVSGLAKNDTLVLKWSCAGGTLSSDSIIDPVFTAPDVSDDQIYTCAVTARLKNRTGKGTTASSDLKVTVKNASIPVTLSSSVSETKAATPIDLTALAAGVPSDSADYYFWCDCSYNSTNLDTAKNQCGEASLKVNRGDPNTYTAKQICKYKFSGNYTPKVIVEKGAEFGENRTTVAVVKKPNNSPVVSAGTDSTVLSGKTISLKGAATDPENDPLTYEWYCDNGKISNIAVLKPVFTAPEVQDNKYVSCRLTVSDGFNFISDSTRVLVKIASSVLAVTASSPVANAGPDKTAKANDVVALDGSKSNDPSGGKLSYKWSCTGGQLKNSTSSVALLTAPDVPVDTDIVCTLEVSNAKESATDTTIIKVLHSGQGGGKNSPPIADAGPSRQVESEGQTSLDGSQSMDIDGTPLTYSWNCDKGSLVNGNSARPLFMAPKVEQQTFTNCALTVSDGNLKASSSTIVVVVPKEIKPDQNNPPIADAGPNITMNENTQTILDGSGSRDPDGDAITYKWACNGGVVSGDTSQYATFTAPKVDQNTAFICTLTAQDTKYAKSSDSTIITVQQVDINLAPIAKIANKTPGQYNFFVIGNNILNLDGSQSSDPNGDPLTYKWSCDNGCFISIPEINCGANINNTAAKVVWRAPNIGQCPAPSVTTACVLTVSDGKLSSTDNAAINVTCVPIGPYCGDHACNNNETAASCPQDCGCGNNICDSGETSTSCPQDCSVCGDGKCTGSETPLICSSDCVSGYVCGDNCANSAKHDKGTTVYPDQLTCNFACSVKYSCSNDCATPIAGGTYTADSAGQQQCMSSCPKYSCSNTCSARIVGGEYMKQDDCLAFCSGSKGYCCNLFGSERCQDVITSSNQWLCGVSPLYKTQSACQAACVFPTTYNCVSGTCNPVSGTGGTYSTLSACQTACTLPAMYSCSNSCDTPIAGGTYGDQISCRTACFPSGMYGCGNGCASPVSGGTYLTQSACQTACYPSGLYGCSNSCLTPFIGGGFTTQAACQTFCAGSSLYGCLGGVCTLGIGGTMTLTQCQAYCH